MQPYNRADQLRDFHASFEFAVAILGDLASQHNADYCGDMSTVNEIEAALLQLSTKELLQVERSLHAIYRQRKDGILYDDAYGLLTEADLIASAEDAFLAYDKEEEKNANRPAR